MTLTPVFMAQKYVILTMAILLIMRHEIQSGCDQMQETDVSIETPGASPDYEFRSPDSPVSPIH